MAPYEEVQPLPCATNQDFITNDDQHPNSLTNQDRSNVKLIGKRLYIDGFLYVKNHKADNGKIHWECRRVRQGTCHARAVTSDPALDKNIVVFRGLEESSHSHAPSLADYEEAEKLEELSKLRERESQSDDQITEDYESSSGSQTVSEIEMQNSITEADVKMEIEELVVAKVEPKPPMQSSENDPDHGSTSSLPRVIGSTLYLHGFMYTKNRVSADSLKAYWSCKKYRSGTCTAKAITSNPAVCQELIIYKGLNQSKHDHLPSHLNQEEDAEETEGFSQAEEDSKSEPVDQTFEQADMETMSVIAGHPTNNSSRFSESMETPDPKAEQSNRQMCLKLIGKRLYIDGYIYVKNSTTSEVQWTCRKYRKTGCTPKVYTSNPFLGEELIVHRIDDLSTHNHSPNELESEEAELIARLEVVRAKLEDSDYAEVPVDKNRTQIQNPVEPRARPGVHQMKSSMVTSSPSNRSIHHIKKKEKSSASSPKTNKSPKMLRVIGKRLCIDGYIFVKSGTYADRYAWECKRYRKTGCRGRASTSDPFSNKNIIIYKGPDESKHNHLPSPAELEDAEMLAKISSIDEKSKSKLPVRSSSRVNAKMCHSYAEDNQSSSFDEVANFASAIASSQGHLQSSKRFTASNQARVSTTSAAPHHGSTVDEAEKQGVVCVDLTDDFDEKSKVESEDTADEEDSSQSNQTSEVADTCIQDQVSPQVSPTQDIETISTQSVGNPYPNFYLYSFGLPQQNYCQNQFAVYPSFANAQHNTAVYHPFNYTSGNFNFSPSSLINGVQLPLIMNVPTRNNAATDGEHFGGHLQVLRQLNRK
ncbi:hypothetical protein QAD02_006757 [Eretmocerus hayati]|uniref:Uncharacterized protein n=1 Tax=Eretmocerus hayati TaxID=131215 RepID=A0ACC2N1S4_9HYME|nr:hypothetical protein QAD02_006757 [Eretmocerus hayati]